MFALAWNDQPQKRLRRRLTAIAFLDVVGYSCLMGADEEATLREWSAVRRGIIEPQVKTWRGRIVNCAGDGLFIEFQSALDAFRWAVNVQDALLPQVQAPAPIRVRIALHLGDVIDGPDGEVQGDGVNTAARLQAHAEPGGVVMSQAMVNEVLGKTDAVFSDLGELFLKNIARPVRTFRLGAAEAAASTELANTVPCGKPMAAAFTAFGPALGALARLPIRRGFALMACSAVVAVLFVVLAPVLERRSASDSAAAATTAVPSIPLSTAREKSLRLLRQGRAAGCPEHPCPREWLAARTLFEQAIAADPDYAPPYAEAAFTYTNFVASGLSLNEKEDLRAAERLATRAAALAPERAFAHEARASVLRQNPDRLEDALAAYLRSLAIEPRQPSIRANAGWMLVLLGRPAEAEPFLQAALTEAPDHDRAPAWLTYLGLAELFLDREGHGVVRFRQALARQSHGAAAGDAVLQRSLGLVAALALESQLDETRLLVDDLRRQHPALSTHTLTLWNCHCSHEPGFVAGLDKLRRGLVLAGVADVR